MYIRCNYEFFKCVSLKYIYTRGDLHVNKLKKVLKESINFSVHIISLI